MTPPLRRWWPDSLLGQLLLALLLGIAVLQGINFYTVCNIQSTYQNKAAQAQQLYLEERQRLLDALPQGARAQFAHAPPVPPLAQGSPAEVWTQRLMVLAESVIFAALVVALLLRVTLPLRRLGQEVEAFGQRPESSRPLPENGSREMREAAQSFNRMRQRICNQLEERDQMLAAMAHDLRTPLTRAQLRLSKVHPQEERDKIAANLEEIHQFIEKGLELATSLGASEDFVTLDATAFVQSLVDDAADTGQNAVFVYGHSPAGHAGSGEARSTADDAAPLLIRARPSCLKRCLNNLLSNALAYGDRAEVRVQGTADSVSIHIADHGPGIPEDMLEQVFTPYFRLESSRNRSFGGVGLGLTIARTMAAHNNARLTLTNRPEGGLVACCVLARAHSAAPGHGAGA